MPGMMITGGTRTRSMPLAYSRRRSGARDLSSRSPPSAATPKIAAIVAIQIAGRLRCTVNCCGLDCPSGAILAGQVLVCVGHVGDLSLLAVVQNFLPLPRAQRDQ